MNQDRRFCICSIVGKTNVGKSTLLNKLLGEKISIVTPKVQTTRTLIRGILTKDHLQAVFIDTPGIFTPNKQLERSMVRAAWAGLEEGMDYCFHIFDATRGITKYDQNIMEVIKSRSAINLAVINKIDRVSKEKLITLAAEIFNSGMYQEVFMTCSVKGDGIEDIITYLNKNAPLSVWMYGEDEVTTVPAKFLASEITREKLFMELGEELPYNLTVETENWEETDTAIKINQLIYVTKANHKKIIIGKQGQMLKLIGSKSRHELMDIFAKKVHLFLFVKVRENWMDDPHIYNYMGIDKA